MRATLPAGAPVPRAPRTGAAASARVGHGGGAGTLTEAPPRQPSPPAARHVATGGRRSDIARRARAAATAAEKTHPALSSPGHLRDAAQSLERGNTEGAKRHLRAAMNQYDPTSLLRHGVLDDEGHTAARQALAAIHRLHLQVTDVQDTEAGNQERLAARHAFMNAPAATPSGGPGNAAEGPKAPIPKGSEQMYSQIAARVIDLVGPHGYVHGWHFVGIPSLADHPEMSHVSMNDRSVITTHLARADRAAKAGDHTGAEMHLRDAQRRAYASHAEDLAAAIQRNLDYQHQQATSFLPANRRTPEQVRQFLNRGSTHQQTPNPQPAFGGLRPGASLPTPKGLQPPRGYSFSAETGRLATTPRPYGRPGGPGLYNVKGLKHSDYLENIVHALMTKRGFDKGKATAIARGAIRKWERGGGKVHPEVRAAAAAAEAQENAAQARAHAHARTGPALEFGWTGWMKEARGSGGQWVSGGGIPGVSSPGTWVPGSGKPAAPKPGKFAVGHKVVTETGDHGVVARVHPNGLIHVRMNDGTVEEHTANELHRHDPGGKLIGALTTLDKLGERTLPGRGKHQAGPRRRLQAYQRQPTRLMQSGMPGLSNDRLRVIDLYNPSQPRVPKGQAGGGQFGSGGGQAKAGSGGKGGKAAQKATLLARAKADRARAHQLEQVLRSLQASQHKMAAGTKAATKAGSTGKTKSSTPAKKTGTAAASAKSAASSATSATSHAATARKISQLRHQITQLLQQAIALTAQAARL